MQLNNAKSRSESEEFAELRRRVDEIQESLKKLHITAANHPQWAVMHQNAETTSEDRIKQLERQIAALKNSED